MGIAWTKRTRMGSVTGRRTSVTDPKFLAPANNLPTKLTDEWMMEHHKTIMYQEGRSIKAVIFYANLPSS